jgi:hypothetical protein
MPCTASLAFRFRRWASVLLQFVVRLVLARRGLGARIGTTGREGWARSA